MEGSLPTCPCCGTAMVVVSETERRVDLSCPSCSVSDVRIKQGPRAQTKSA